MGLPGKLLEKGTTADMYLAFVLPIFPTPCLDMDVTTGASPTASLDRGATLKMETTSQGDGT